MLVHLQAPLWTPPTLMKVCIFVIHETWSVLRHTARKIILGWKQEIWEFSKWKAKGRIFLILWKYSTSPNHSHCAAEDNAETVWFIQRGHHGQLQRHMSSIQKHLSLHLLMHGLYHSHADRKCRVYCALEQGSLFDWILVLTTVKSAGHSVPNHFSQLPREKVSGPARNRWTWKSCPPSHHAMSHKTRPDFAQDSSPFEYYHYPVCFSKRSRSGGYLNYQCNTATNFRTPWFCRTGSTDTDLAHSVP